jgi:hypothetical protein
MAPCAEPYVDRWRSGQGAALRTGARGAAWRGAPHGGRGGVAQARGAAPMGHRGQWTTTVRAEAELKAGHEYKRDDESSPWAQRPKKLLRRGPKLLVCQVRRGARSGGD